MKKLFLAMAALTILASTPALAQDVRVRTGPNGVVIRTETHPTYRHGSYQRYGYRPNRQVIVRDRANGCRVITTRTRRADGSVVVRKVRRCG